MTSTTSRTPVPVTLPLYLGLWPAPLLIAHPQSNCRWFPSEADPDLAFVVTRTKRVLLWTAKRAMPLGTLRGGREIGMLPSGHLIHWGPNGRDAVAVTWVPKSKSFAVVTWLSEDGPPRTVRLPFAEQPRGIAVENGFVGIGTSDRVSIVNAEDGIVADEALANPVAWSRSFARTKGHSSWRELMVGEGVVRWTKVSHVPPVDIYERGQHLGDPIGGVYSSDWVSSRSSVRLGSGVTLMAEPGGVALCFRGARTRMLRVLARTVPPRWLSVSDVEARTSKGPSPVEHCGKADLESVTSARFPASRFLKGGQFPDGSRIWTDSRGLLHLASSNASLGQLTMTLHADPPFTAWCSQGWELCEANDLRLTMGEPHPLSHWLMQFVAHVLEGGQGE